MRDLDLGRPVRDVDLVVEGDGIAFARELSARLEAAVREHERFGTATLTLANGEKLDVASTRRETYAHPGALPTVTAGASIAEDLARRDFTINAMALGLRPQRRRIDPFGGQEDLARGLVRALHPGSFIDDPTRGFRAVRYANRLGFRIHAATRREIAAAPALRALGRVSGDRVRREIRLIFEEPRRGRATAQLGALGLARAVDTALATGRPAARVARAEALVPAIAGKTTWLCYLLAWMWRTDEVEAGRVADRLALAGAEGRILRRWPETARRLSSAEVASGTTSDEVAAAAAALPPAAARVARAGGSRRGPPRHPGRGPPGRRGACRSGRRRGARPDAGRAAGRPDRGEGRVRIRAGGGEGGPMTALLLLAAALAAGPTPTPTPEPPKGPTFCVEWIRQSSEGYERLTLFRDGELVWKTHRGGKDQVKRERLDASEAKFFCEDFFPATRSGASTPTCGRA